MTSVFAGLFKDEPMPSTNSNTLLTENAELKMRIKVYTYDEKKASSDWYYMTVDEMDNQCCIYACQLFFKKSIPKKYELQADEWWATPYDIYNYEPFPWYEDGADENCKYIVKKAFERRRGINFDEYQKQKQNANILAMNDSNLITSSSA